MDETRAVVHLPNLDVEILHCQLPDQGAEQLLISLRAQPSFDALARAFEGSGAASAWLALNPLLAWQQAALAFWAPRLTTGSRTLPRAGGESERGQQG